jgi:hypothetical protein
VHENTPQLDVAFIADVNLSRIDLVQLWLRCVIISGLKPNKGINWFFQMQIVLKVSSELQGSVLVAIGQLRYFVEKDSASSRNGIHCLTKVFVNVLLFILVSRHICFAEITEEDMKVASVSAHIVPSLPTFAD